VSGLAGRPSPRAYANLLSACFFLFAGTFAAVGLHNGLRPPSAIVVAAMLAATLWGMLVPRVTRLNLLPRMMLFVYALPFSALLGYLIWDDYLWVFTARGFALGQDPEVMSVLTLTGLTGVCALVAAFHTVTAFTDPSDHRARPNTSHALGNGIFAVLIALAVGLSVLSSAPETVFQSAYGARQGDSAAAAINFPAAFLLSYVVFVLLWIDIERETDLTSRRWKMVGLVVAVTYVVVVLQILRGDRESSGLIAAFAALYLTAPTVHRFAPSSSVVRARLVRLVLPLAVLVTIFIALGKAREAVSQISERLSLGQMVRLGFSQNTWTGVLWTNLGTAWEFQQERLNYRMGKTYVDYALSLPPGVVSRAYGYVRPEESGQGLASEDPAGVSSGGLHVVITPFKNFGALGVLGVLFIYGTLIGLAERANGRGGQLARFLWASAFCASFIWFWYGDMPIIRAVMAVLIFFPFYNLAISSRYVFGRSRLSMGAISGPRGSMPRSEPFND
jgi:hypothetical protein